MNEIILLNTFFLFLLFKCSLYFFEQCILKCMAFSLEDFYFDTPVSREQVCV